MIITFGKINYDWRHFYKIFLKYSTPHSKVIEIGASDTSKTDELSKHCQSITGVELYKNRLPQNHQNIKYVQADWQKISKFVPKNYFDILISSHTIEHVPDDLKAINETYSILNNNGIALLITPNRKRFTRLIIEFITGPRKFPYWEHIREYTKEDITKLINKSKFTKYKITPIIFGIHSGFGIFTYKIPSIFKKYANYWQITLFK